MSYTSYVYILFLNPDFHPIKTEIKIGRDWVTSYLQETSFGKKGAILADEKVSQILGIPFQKGLGPGFDLIAIRGGEASKSREEKERLEDELFKKKHGRDTLLIALGGGVTTDLAAYVASTYMRGVSLILVPTSLLAMVDASIGGKTGVDTPFGKNQIGTFYFPNEIWVDTAFLSTLPKKEWSNGLAEIVKYGLILEPQIWEWIAEAPDWREPALLEKLIPSSIQAKMKVVEKDPLEQTGYRRILNFGHTIGHGLELVSNYGMDHGQAVALGCIAESYLSHLLGYLSKKDLERILKLYGNLPFDLKWLSHFSPHALWEAMLMDKKSKGGEIRCVLIEQIGKCVPFEGNYCRTVSRSELESTFDWMQKAYS